MEGLNINNILDEDEMSLFTDDGATTEKEEDKVVDTEENNKESEQTAEVNTEDLFGDQESVGSEEDNKGNEEDTHSNKDAESPKSNFFSSIAEAFAEEGILPNLDEDTAKNIKSPEDFRKAIDDYIKSELDEQQQRIKDALDNNIDTSVVRQYEGILNYLNNMSEDSLKAENEDAENLRRRLIYQDYINRGFDKTRAEKEVNKSIQNGTDIDDAIDAWNSNKEFYSDGYNNLIKKAKEEKAAEEAATKERAENLRKNMLDVNNSFFGDYDIDKATRQKAYECISKPVYRDKQTGETYTTIQKYEMDNSDEFISKLGLIFTLTDGFKSLDGLVKGRVKREVKKGLKDLENKINNTSRDQYGNLKYVSGVDDDSYLGKGIRLNI